MAFGNLLLTLSKNSFDSISLRKPKGTYFLSQRFEAESQWEFPGQKVDDRLPSSLASELVFSTAKYSSILTFSLQKGPKEDRDIETKEGAGKGRWGTDKIEMTYHVSTRVTYLPGSSSGFVQADPTKWSLSIRANFGQTKPSGYFLSVLQNKDEIESIVVWFICMQNKPRTRHQMSPIFASTDMWRCSHLGTPAVSKGLWCPLFRPNSTSKPKITSTPHKDVWWLMRSAYPLYTLEPLPDLGWLELVRDEEIQECICVKVQYHRHPPMLIIFSSSFFLNNWMKPWGALGSCS